MWEKIAILYYVHVGVFVAANNEFCAYRLIKWLHEQNLEQFHCKKQVFCITAIFPLLLMILLLFLLL